MDAVLLERYLEHVPFALSTARYRILQLDCGSIDNNLPSKTLAAGQRLYTDGLLAAKYVFFTESDQVVWWTPEALAEAIAAIDRAPSTYFSPYRLEETYLAAGKHYASRVKDTTGPLVTFEGVACLVSVRCLYEPPRTGAGGGIECAEAVRAAGRKYTVTNQCEHLSFPKVATSPASRKASPAAQARRGECPRRASPSFAPREQAIIQAPAAQGDMSGAFAATPLPRTRPPAATSTNRRRTSGHGLRA